MLTLHYCRLLRMSVFEQTRLELLKWIGKHWLGICQERGFDALEGWASSRSVIVGPFPKNHLHFFLFYSLDIVVPIHDLLNPLPQSAITEKGNGNN
jgi:hypothetical protein